MCLQGICLAVRLSTMLGTSDGVGDQQWIDQSSRSRYNNVLNITLDLWCVRSVADLTAGMEEGENIYQAQRSRGLPPGAEVQGSGCKGVVPLCQGTFCISELNSRDLSLPISSYNSPSLNEAVPTKRLMRLSFFFLLLFCHSFLPFPSPFFENKSGHAGPLPCIAWD